MRALDINKENLDNQIGTVSEERRQGVDNQPYGRTSEVLDDLAYKNFAYRHSVIGSIDDLRAATVDDVAAFFKMYYAPNNAVLAIVGDVKTAECLAKVRQYFESIPRQPRPPRSTSTEPPQTAEQRQTIDDPLAKLRADRHRLPHPAVDDARRRRAVGGRHDPVRRPQLALLRDHRPAEAAVVERDPRRPGRAAGPGCSGVGGMANPGKAVADLEQAIYDEVERLKSGPIEAWEIEKARNSAMRGFVVEPHQLALAGDDALAAAPCTTTIPASSTPGTSGCRRSRRPTCSAWRSSTSRRRTAPSSSPIRSRPRLPPARRGRREACDERHQNAEPPPSRSSRLCALPPAQAAAQAGLRPARRRRARASSSRARRRCRTRS